MNKIFIIGNLTKDPDPIRTVTAKNGNIDVCSFTVATSRKHASNDSDQTTDFFRVNAWRGLAEVCHKYLAKGKKVYVSGELNATTYTKDGRTYLQLNVNADEVEFLSPRGEQAAPDPVTAPDPVQVSMDQMQDISTEDIPF